MKWSLYVGKPAGIKVFIHWTFLLLIAWLFWMHLQQGNGLYEIVMGFIFLVALFGCVTLHEFGHALMARKYGIGTRDINLLPIGGVARLESMPEDPKEELSVAAAGPAVNVAIAAGLYMLMLLMGHGEIEVGFKLAGETFWGDLFAVNVILVVFNLIPAFPMDGGRMLRAMLAFNMSRNRATQIAASIGQFLAIGFVLLGLFYNPFLIFIGIFVYLGAGAEARHVSMTESVKHLKVKDFMKDDYSWVAADATIAEAASIVIESRAPELVVRDGVRLEGLISHTSIIKALQQGESDESVKKYVRQEVQTVGPDLSLLELMSTLQFGERFVYPVVQDGKILGLVTETELNAIQGRRQLQPAETT